MNHTPKSQLKAARKILWRLYGQQLKQHWKLALPGLVLPGIGSTLVFYVPPLIISDILRRMESGETFTFESALPLVLAFAGVWLLGEALWRFAMFCLLRVQVRAEKGLFETAMKYMFDKEMAFFADNFAGSLTKKTISFARNFTSLTDQLSMNILNNLFPLVLVTIVLWQFSPLIVLALYVVLLLTVVLIVPLIRRRQSLVLAREAASNVVSGRIADMYTNMEQIKVFAGESREMADYSAIVDDYEALQKKSWDYQNQKIDMTMSPLYVAVNTAGLVAALFLSTRGVENVSVIFLTYSYFVTYTRAMWEFNHIYRQLETHISDALQFTSLLVEPPKVNDPKRALKPAIKRGLIEFDNVHFQYNEHANQLFADMNFSIKPGEKVGLVGPSGGGKTTIVKLLLRFMDIDSGAIKIDSQNIAELKQTVLRSHIAYVPQEPVLFHRSIRENIRYGNPKVTDEEVSKAAQLAHAAEFIDTLPDGYDTLVGERGMKLSGGQKQRVAIARAMLVKAPVLLLDEATSALDSKSEKLIADALDTLMKNRTTIVIAHRLSTIRKLDRILVMKEGRLVEEGTHNELLATKGVYEELWRHQSGDFLDE